MSVMCSLIRINGEMSKMTVLPGVGESDEDDVVIIRKQNRNRARKNRKSPEDGRAKSAEIPIALLQRKKAKKLRSSTWKTITTGTFERVQAYELVVSETSETPIADKKRLYENEPDEG